MAISDKLESAVILKTQIIDDAKNGIADGSGTGSFRAGMAEFTRLAIQALQKYVGER